MSRRRIRLIINWNIVLASIARISLLVGGGATDPEIFGQFLIESVSLSLIGGLIGAALGYGATLLAGQAFPDGLPVSPLGLFLAAAHPRGVRSG